MNDRSPKNWRKIAQNQKQATGWRCQACQKLCRMPGESLTDFIQRTGYDATQVQAHSRRWVLTVSCLDPVSEHPGARLRALCGSCHRAEQNAQMTQIKYKKREAVGQLRLDQAPPVALEGTQLSLVDWVPPQAVANVQPGVRYVTVATLVDWLRTQLQQWQPRVDPIAYLQGMQPDAQCQASNLASLSALVPYKGRFRQEDLQIACTQVLKDFANIIAQQC